MFYIEWLKYILSNMFRSIVHALYFSVSLQIMYIIYMRMKTPSIDLNAFSEQLPIHVFRGTSHGTCSTWTWKFSGESICVCQVNRYRNSLFPLTNTCAGEAKCENKKKTKKQWNHVLSEENHILPCSNFANSVDGEARFFSHFPETSLPKKTKSSLPCASLLQPLGPPV